MYVTDAILLLDSAHHDISTREYQYLNKQSIRVFFILNINNDILSQLAGINIINASGTADYLRRRFIDLSCDEPPEHNQQVYLTHAESVILRLYMSGLSSSQISQIITVKKKTVYSHVRNILHKTGIKKVTHLTILKTILNFHLSHS
ncbi:TPA: helix-turn-helix transcriptional regulator [Klebsiella pneumoniae]|nr:helix-turn-helix transcriptional regulator [Klebsiella pneumoniae]